jgi:hypothetical protein
MQGPGVVGPLVWMFVWMFAPNVSSSFASGRRNRIFVVAFIAGKENVNLYMDQTL